MRALYGRVRTLPIVGPATSRAVWAIKGLLGRPVRLAGAAACPAPPAARRSPPAHMDVRLQVALTAVEALSQRLAALETPAPAAPLRRASPLQKSSGQPSVSVVVSTLNRAAWLDRALNALAYQRHPAFEIIVVAGPSEDDTPDILARHADRIRLVACPVANLSASRNRGLAVAGGEVVAFLDDDAAPEPDWLDRLCTPFADPAVGGVGGVIRDAGGIDFQCRTVVADRFGQSEETDPRCLAALSADAPVERYLSLTGANCAFRRDALMSIGGFDEAYAYFLDETDVCLRLVEAGWRLTVAGDAEVHHGYAPSLQRRADHTPLRLYDPVRSTAYFSFRNGAPVRGWMQAATRLHTYAEGVRRDIAWRCAHGMIDAEAGDRLQADVTAGLDAGVRLAMAGPRKLMESAPDIPRRRPTTAPARRPAGDRLRIGLLSQDYPGEEARASPPGGIAVWTHALAQALSERGHEVSVFARAAAGAPPTVAFEVKDGSGVWVHRYDASEGGGRASGLLIGTPASVARPAQAAAREVLRMDGRRAFDLVMGPLWDLEPAALVGTGPWPTAVSLHTACAQMLPYRPEWTSAYRRSHVDRLIEGERRLLRCASHVLSNSRAAARDIGEALGLSDLADKAAVVPHGLPDLARRVTAPRRQGTDEIDILFVGRLEARKGVATLLNAAPGLLNAAANARLTLVGEDVAVDAGPGWREAFRARHSGAPWLERVTFAGPLSRGDLLARYAACDIVLTPSLYESFGLTALEAMIFAKPCIASRTGGLAEIVAPGETGLLTQPGDGDALVEAVLTLSRSPTLRSAMGLAGRRRYEALFTAETMATAFEGWAAEVVSSRQRFAAE